MAASTENQYQNSNSVKFDDPYYLSNGDHPGMQLGNHILTGSNFLNWSRTVRMALIARNKLQFVDGSLPSPGVDSPDYQKWLRNDYMVMSWILNSIDKNLVESFMFVNSSHGLWKEISERFGQSNAPQLFELHRNLIYTNQNNDSIAEYYGKLKSVWDQLHVIEGFPDCTCGALASCSCGILKKLLEMEQRKKLIQLLSGLNRNYDQVTINLLSVDPLPNVNKAYHTLQQIEQQNRLNQFSSSSHEISAFHVASGNIAPTPKVFPKPNFQYKKDFKRAKSELTCEHCKKRDHTVDQCFKLYGVPDWFTTLKNKGSARVAGNVSGSGAISSGSASCNSADPVAMTNLYNQFYKMMQQNSDNPLSSAVNFAGIVVASNVELLDEVFHKDAWIVDTGASDHMAGNIDLFASLTSLQNPIKIKLPDGTITSVLYAGSVILTPEISISDVLFVPTFKHNLLSVGKMLDQHQLHSHFTNDSCLFQDPVTRAVRAIGTRHSGLYKFTYVGSISDQQSPSGISLDMVNPALDHADLGSTEILETGSVSPPVLRHSSRPRSIPRKFDNFQVTIPGISTNSDSVSQSFNVYTEPSLLAMDVDTKLNLIKSKQDYSMFIKKDKKSFTLVVVYVDDLLITGNDSSAISILKSALHDAFTIKDLGSLKYFLGIEVSRSNSGILLNQRKYILDMLRDAHMESCNPASFPLPKDLKLSDFEGDELSGPEIFRKIIENPVFHEKTKHLRSKHHKLDVHFVRENVQSGFIQTVHVKSALQLADIMTKPLGADLHKFMCFKIGLVIQPPTQDWVCKVQDVSS
uniref:Reverse transcriptase Ty1/copia-type domain-containing protein n=1 Tax=Chenopodium quinoa TaxID=63459 RepID=A0A803MDK1_CHEQI